MYCSTKRNLVELDLRKIEDKNRIVWKIQWWRGTTDLLLQELAIQTIRSLFSHWTASFFPDTEHCTLLL